MQLDALAGQLGSLQQQALDALAQAAHREDAIQIKNRFLGRKGQVAELMQLMRELSGADKPQAGQLFNRCKHAIEAAYEAQIAMLDAAELERRLAAEAIDVTLPATPLTPRPAHPLRQVEEEICAIFSEMGFQIAEGPEVEWDRYNFELLNFPADHPARDMQDTFMLRDGRLLRTHTSPVQIRTMLAYAPPVSVISPGRVYRVDSDTTHSPVFHQVEGLLVGESVTFANLKATLERFAQRCFGPNTPVRFRASFFPFTEPSAEVDVGCIFCAQQGCRVCKQTGWLEIMGCGMVDPNVLTAVGIDPERFTGFAFGMGVERIAMLKLRIDDIRLFYDNNLRFLSQFV
jgi:phenylalanyl-tRNA synthetase alpha chain